MNIYTPIYRQLATPISILYYASILFWNTCALIYVWIHIQCCILFECIYTLTLDTQPTLILTHGTCHATSFSRVLYIVKSVIGINSINHKSHHQYEQLLFPNPVCLGVLNLNCLDLFLNSTPLNVPCSSLSIQSYSMFSMIDACLLSGTMKVCSDLRSCSVWPTQFACVTWQPPSFKAARPFIFV